MRGGGGGVLQNLESGVGLVIVVNETYDSTRCVTLACSCSSAARAAASFSICSFAAAAAPAAASLFFFSSPLLLQLRLLQQTQRLLSRSPLLLRPLGEYEQQLPLSSIFVCGYNSSRTTRFCIFAF